MMSLLFLVGGVCFKVPDIMSTIDHMVAYYCFCQVAEIPKLTAGCNDFTDEAQQILEKRKLNRILLANQSTLLDLLEIPQLMDT